MVGMMKSVSLIPAGWVDAATKALSGNRVAFSNGVTTLGELAELVMAFDVAPAVFLDNIKTNASLLSTDWLIYDFDDGTVSARVHEILTGDNYRGWRLNHLIAGSKNHLRDKGDGKGAIERFHVFIPLKAPITDAELYTFTLTQFSRLFLRGTTPDPACKDVSRYLAKHSAILFMEEGGIDLPLEMFIELRRLRDRPRPRPKIQVEGDAVDRFHRTRAFGLLRSGMSADGNRYGTSSKIIGVMKKCGLSLDQALALFDQHATYGESFTRESVERRWCQFH